MHQKFRGNWAQGCLLTYKRIASLLVIIAMTGAGVTWSRAAAPFTNTMHSFPGVEYASAAWGDYDADGWMDIVFMGCTNARALTQLYHNTGAGFTNANAGFPQVGDGFVAWGDYDNDGGLDILLNGQTAAGQALTQVWRNTGNGFSNIQAGITGVFGGEGGWGDFDNDGRLDILLTGYAVDGSIRTEIWHNTGSSFSNRSVSLPGVHQSSVACADFDEDGKLDLVLSGLSGTTVATDVWRNTGHGFEPLNVRLPAIFYSSVACGDYDQDGRTDLLLSGSTGTNAIAQLWRNTGAGFIRANASIPDIQLGSLAWGDFENDGALDILLTGRCLVPNSFQEGDVWRNAGTNFTRMTSGLPRIAFSCAVPGDFNHDGRLDVFIAGQSSNHVLLAQLWANVTAASNHPPTEPVGLSSVASDAGVLLSWNAGTDAETAAGGLTYNVRVGTSPGGRNVVAPQALNNGLRLVPQPGNCQSRLFMVLTNLSPGNYYWSVQSIDAAFSGSPFADEKWFSIGHCRLSITIAPGGRMVISGQGDTGTNYTLQGSTDLRSWTNLTSLAAGPDGNFGYTNTMSPPRQFYRVRQP